MGESKDNEIWESNEQYLFSLIAWTCGLTVGTKFLVLLESDNYDYNAAGTYLIQYFILILLVGIPLTHMECGLAQFSASGQLTIWKMCPILRGVGYSQLILLFYSQVFNRLLTAIVVSYAGIAMVTTLPWENCDNIRNNGSSLVDSNNTICYEMVSNETTFSQCRQEYGQDQCNKFTWIDSAQYYFAKKVLNELPLTNKAKIGELRPIILCGSLFTSVCVYLTNFKGLKVLKKLLRWFIAYPAVIILTVLFTSFVRKGSIDGFLLFLRPNFIFFRSTKNWLLALDQVFMIGLGLGGFANIASRANFRAPCHMIAILFGMVHLMDPFSYAAITYNGCGIISYDLNIKIDNVFHIQSSAIFGKMLNTVMFLKGLKRLWVFLFYSSLFISNLRTESLNLFHLWLAFSEKYPKMKGYIKLFMSIGSVCIFLFAIPLCTQTGYGIIHILETVIRVVLSCNIFLQVISVTLIYGVNRFVDDMHFMLGFRSSWYFQISWWLSPIFTTILLFEAFRKMYIFFDDTPFWLVLVFTVLTAIPFLVILIFCLITLKQYRHRHSCKSTSDWGPADKLLRKSRQMFSSHSMTKEYMYRQNKMKSRFTEKYKESGGQHDAFAW